MVPTDFVERVAKIDLQKPELGTLVALEGVAERVRHDFHSTRATHTVVPALERLLDLTLACDAETLGNRRGSPQQRGRTEVLLFSRAMETRLRCTS